MKRIATLMAISLMLAAAEAGAKPPASRQTASCQAEADRKGLKGSDRKGFLKECTRNAKDQAKRAPDVPPPAKPGPAIPVPFPTRGTNPVRPAE